MMKGSRVVNAGLDEPSITSYVILRET